MDGPMGDSPPVNILISEDNQVKICDFGVSKILNSEEVRPCTQSSAFAGISIPD